MVFAESRDEFLFENRAGLFNKTSSPLPCFLPPSSSLMAASKILITEDEILIARELESALLDLGYQVVAIAPDGPTALERVMETQPDLVLMDVVLPGEMDGIEVAEQIRDRFHIPVVYLTAYADAETLQRASITEPFGYILKPFQPQELHATLQIALMRHSVELQKLKTLRRSVSTAIPHEINTPLTGIVSSVELLTYFYDSLSKEEVLDQLNSLQNTASRLNRTCQNLLFHTELEVLASDPRKLAMLHDVGMVSSRFSVQEWAEKKAVEYGRVDDLHLDLQSPQVPMSEYYLRRLVEEVVDNAFKFSPAGTPVGCRSFCQNQACVLVVSDRGRGMHPAQVANIDAYVQFDRSRYEQQGLGLGLALVRRLVELHQGQVSIASTVDEGTTITIGLPMPAGGPL